jgi:hypothetical protein
MSYRFPLSSLAALLLAGAALVGCGGSDAEPPPPPLGAVPASAAPDTTAPTMTIADNVPAPTATGPVTFSFVFSEDVGVSFEAADITVSGGTAGAFTRVDGRQATLVVTPTPNVAGTMTVSVAAGRFTDIAGNANAAAASASKDYAAPPPPPPPAGLLLADFDTVSPPIAGFEGGEGSAVEAGPAGGSGNALKVLRSGGQVFALAIVTLPSNIPLEAGRRTLSARVYSPTAGIPMVLKLEGPGGNPSSGDVQANEAVVAGWQTLTWTINAVNTNYNVIVLLPNLGTVDAPPGKSYFFDDIVLLGAASGGGGLVLANFDTVSPPIAGFEGGEGSAVEAGPAGGSGNALKVLRSGGQVFALAIVTLPSNIPLEAGRRTISARVHSPTAGIPMVLKLEGPGGSPSSGDLQANEAVVVGWQTLTWTVPTANTNYNVLVLLPNLGTVDAPPGKAYYFDDITLLAAASGGGGGGGTGPVVFSSGFAGGNRTVQGGAFGGYGGSSLDNFGCSGDPAWCGSGGNFVPGATAADSGFFFYYQTPSPVTALYAGIFVQAPGLTTGLSGTADTPGVSISGKTTMKFRFNQNPEWFNGPAKNFGVILTLGKFYDVDAGPAVAPCNIKLLAVVTPTSAAATDYAVPISSFDLIQTCGVGGLTPASALALSPLSQVDFQGVGSSNPLPAVGGKLVGANMSVPVGSPAVYPTTLAVTGGVTFE